MKKIYHPALLLLALVNFCILQTFGQKKWEKVPQKFKGIEQFEFPNYGSETNPSPRTDVLSWVDNEGQLWLFGGAGLDEEKNWGLFQDMWKYDPKSNNWELLEKSERNKVHNNNKGLSKVPLPRRESLTWVDQEGNFWLAGGRSLIDFSHFDDVWKFDKSKRQWESVSGEGKFNQKASVKSNKKNSEDALNSIGSRSASINWTDSKGNLWLFGGISNNNGESALFEFNNDLWKFNVKNKKWAWIDGSLDASKQNLSSKANKSDLNKVPSPRAKSSFWYNSKTDELWLYGGLGLDSLTGSIGGLSDLWVFDSKKESWSKRYGSSNVSQPKEIFLGHVFHDKNSPGGRISAMSWSNDGEELYLMGGQNTFTDKVINIDKTVWVFSTKLNQWKVLDGAEAPIISGGTAFQDKEGNVFTFGGQEFDKKDHKSKPSNNIWKLSTKK